MIDIRTYDTAEHEPPVMPAELQPVVQSILATLADIDFAHEKELEKLNHSDLNDAFKLRLAAKLDQLHRERREPYVQELMRLQDRFRSLLSRVQGERSQSKQP